jgi:hypothetical protein
MTECSGQRDKASKNICSVMFERKRGEESERTERDDKSVHSLLFIIGVKASSAVGFWQHQGAVARGIRDDNVKVGMT